MSNIAKQIHDLTCAVKAMSDVELDWVCVPLDDFDIDSNTVSDCDPADLEVGDLLTYSWQPSVPAGAEVCYPAPAVNNGGVWSITGTLNADGATVDFPSSENGNLPGYVLYGGRCYDLPTPLCSGGNVPVTITGGTAIVRAKVNWDGDTCTILDPETGEEIEGATLCGEEPMFLEDVKAKFEAPTENCAGPCAAPTPKIANECYVAPESSNLIEGSEAAPWVIIPGVLELVRNAGGGGTPGFTNNAPGGLEYSLDGTNFGAFGSAVLGGDLPGTVFIRNTATGDTVEAQITSWAGGGNNAFAGVAVVVTPEQAYTCQVADGARTCLDALGQPVDFDAGWTLIECPTVIGYLESQPPTKTDERCYQRTVTLVDTDDIIDGPGRVPVASEPVVVVPRNSGEVCAISIRVDNINSQGAADPAFAPGIPIAIEINGTVYEFDPFLSNRIDLAQTAPLPSNPGNIPPGRYNLHFPTPGLTAVSAVPLTIKYVNDGSAGFGDPNLVQWTVNTASDNGQVQALATGAFPQVTLFGCETECWSECDFWQAGETFTVTYGPDGAVTDEPTPTDAEQVRCDCCSSCGDSKRDLSNFTGECCTGNPEDGDRFCTRKPPATFEGDVKLNGATTGTLATGWSDQDLLDVLGPLFFFDGDGALCSVEHPGTLSYSGQNCSTDPDTGVVNCQKWQVAFPFLSVSGDPAECTDALKVSSCLDPAILQALTDQLATQQEMLAKLCELVDSGCVEGCANIGQRTLLNPATVWTYGPHTANGIDNLKLVLGSYGYTITDTAIYNANGNEIGDLRRVCITGPKEFPLLANGADVGLEFRKVDCSPSCGTVEVPA